MKKFNFEKKKIRNGNIFTLIESSPKNVIPQSAQSAVLVRISAMKLPWATAKNKVKMSNLDDISIDNEAIDQ